MLLKNINKAHSLHHQITQIDEYQKSRTFGGMEYFVGRLSPKQKNKLLDLLGEFKKENLAEITALK